MLNASQYNDPKLDKATQDQLFRLFVEQKFAEIEAKIPDKNELLKTLADLSTRIKNLENLKLPIRADILETKVKNLEMEKSQKKFSIMDWFK